MTATVIHGDCIAEMRAMADASFEAIVTDPPYLISFMGSTWDSADGIAGKPEVWREALRVLKPGGHMLAMGSTRTFHRMVTAIEDAGFEVRDTTAWIYGSGFPKSLNVSNALRSLPPCRCEAPEVGGDLDGIVNPGGPFGLSGASVGAEPGFVEFAGTAADGAGGLDAQAGAVTLRGELGVQSGVEQRVGHLGPEMLGAFEMTDVAKRDEIAGEVCGIEAEPEPLRDQVVNQQTVAGAAIHAGAVSGDDGGGNAKPSGSFVFPLASTPSGISVSGHSATVINSHASSGAVGSGSSTDQSVSGKPSAAVAADEFFHGSDYATKRRASVRCARCGGVIQENIPEGLGTALKPAMELICVARKPLTGTVAQNVLAHGCGALNIDASRIGTTDNTARTNNGTALGIMNDDGWQPKAMTCGGSPLGRWPANVITDGSPEVLDAFAAFGTSKSSVGKRGGVAEYRRSDGATTNDGRDSANWDAYRAAAEQRTRGHSDEGTAARFFYAAKASKSDRAGSTHPTVKPLSLMRYLCRLACPPGGTVLDMFCGTGTTLLAAQLEGFHAVGIEQDAAYVADARRRLGLTFELEAAD